MSQVDDVCSGAVGFHGRKVSAAYRPMLLWGRTALVSWYV